MDKKIGKVLYCLNKKKEITIVQIQKQYNSDNENPAEGNISDLKNTGMGLPRSGGVRCVCEGEGGYIS